MVRKFEFISRHLLPHVPSVIGRVMVFYRFKFEAFVGRSFVDSPLSCKVAHCTDYRAPSHGACTGAVYRNGAQPFGDLLLHHQFLRRRCGDKRYERIPALGQDVGAKRVNSEPCRPGVSFSVPPPSPFPLSLQATPGHFPNPGCLGRKFSPRCVVVLMPTRGGGLLGVADSSRDAPTF